MRSNAIETILSTLYEKDKYSEFHSRQVSKISEQLAIAHKLDDQLIKDIKTAGLLHDIGKIIIPSDILTKVGKLTVKEREVINTHSEIGFRILNSSAHLREISKIVLNHHECWDGTGYPRNIMKNDIPIEARIISIADAFDAMTSERLYRKTLSFEQAKSEIVNSKGLQFDPDLVDTFVLNFDTIIDKVFNQN
jgi:putative nucleotidyltransferase with HDIG domain